MCTIKNMEYILLNVQRGSKYKAQCYDEVVLWNVDTAYNRMCFVVLNTKVFFTPSPPPKKSDGNPCCNQTCTMLFTQNDDNFTFISAGLTCANSTSILSDIEIESKQYQDLFLTLLQKLAWSRL